MTLVRSRTPVAAGSSDRFLELLEKNRRFLWNPFTQMQEYLKSQPLIIKGGDGVILTDVTGARYYDGNSSLWVNIHGHGRRELNDAITTQLGSIAHSTLLGMGNIPAIELAERLVALSPPGLGKVFYSDSGATAVEIGVKMAFAYWRRVGRPEKARFVSFSNAYHGDTVACMSLGGIDVFRAEFGPLLMDVHHAPFPNAYRFAGSGEQCAESAVRQLEIVFENHAGEIACMVVEPMIQAAGGMVVMPPAFLSRVAKLCRDYEVLLLADEVATGFGRTAAMFACEHEDVSPDLMAVGKGLTGGYLPVAATLATDEIYDAFLGGFAESKTFFHGHSFTGNQLGCAVALASLDLIETDGLMARTGQSAAVMAQRLEHFRGLPHVGDVRQMGLMAGIELAEDKQQKQPYPWQEAMGVKVCRRARELGMITRPLGDVVVFMPAPAASCEDINAMADILLQAVAETTGS